MNKITVGLIVVALMGSTVISYADGVVIPFSIKTDAFKKEIKSRGLDLYGTDKSDGEIQNNGTSMKIITYKPVTSEQMDLMKDVANKTVRK